MSTDRSARSGLSRRALLGRGALGAAALSVASASGGALAWSAAAGRSDPTGAHGMRTVPFHGAHQAGIETPAVPPPFAAFIGLDLRPGAGAAELRRVLRLWTDDAARLTAGEPALADPEPELAEQPAELTVTVGLGPEVFDRIGRADARPEWLAPLPDLPIDRLDPAWGQTDLIAAVAAGDPVTLAHAVRTLSRSVRAQATVRWVQRGFREAHGTRPEGATMRNLMGQRDGTVNPVPGTDDFAEVVWDDGAAQPWLAGGTAMVLRRIRIDMDTWEEADPPMRDLSMGRFQGSGAPLTGTEEFDEADFDATDRYGIPVIPPTSHIARARPRAPHERFYRRAYNYDEAPAPGRTSESGLLFVTYQRDVTRQFLPVQERLAEQDALNIWTVPIGSAVYAVLPGIDEGGRLGDTLLPD